MQFVCEYNAEKCSLNMQAGPVAGPTDLAIEDKFLGLYLFVSTSTTLYVTGLNIIKVLRMRSFSSSSSSELVNGSQSLKISSSSMLGSSKDSSSLSYWFSSSWMLVVITDSLCCFCPSLPPLSSNLPVFIHRSLSTWWAPVSKEFTIFRSFLLDSASALLASPDEVGTKAV